ncbi:phage tail protein I, partial [Escherichia coli]|nr:phage tail protein I [Escherichia coli]
LVIKAKNLRSGLSTIDVNTDIGKESPFYVGGAVTAHIDVVIEAGE